MDFCSPYTEQKLMNKHCGYNRLFFFYLKGKIWVGQKDVLPLATMRKCHNQAI